MAAKLDDFSIKKISPKLGGERGTRNPNGPTSSHDLVEQMEFLYVKLIKHRDAKAIIPYGYIPFVEITLGNYKSSTKNQPIEPEGKWNNLVFAFDKTKGDVLTVTLNIFQPQQPEKCTVVGKQTFKVAADIPSRVLPDASLASRWYSMQDMELEMSIWFGTQTDEVYSQAWFSDAYHVNASCVTNTRPTFYEAPRLCMVRVTIVSGHDLFSNDGKRSPSVYVTVTIGKFSLKTGIASGSNPSWNQDLLFVTSEPLDDIAFIKLFDRVDDQHEECIGSLEKKLSEMTALKTPGSAPVLFYDIKPPVKVEPAGDTRRFASTIKMKLATDQAYHVAEECSLYSSDYRAFAKGLWPGVLGKLEIGILGASGLPAMKDWGDGRKSTDAYVVAKYGNKWARTRTVVDSFSPKWNEQYSWDVYDTSTTITLGLYDNCQILAANNVTKDAPIGKVRIPLSRLEWGTTYTVSIPILGLGKGGLKKSGELQLAIRCLWFLKSYPKLVAYSCWILPKAHYKSPISLLQKEALRVQAVEMNCLNLARTEPPLRNEVVTDMLKPASHSFSFRRAKANWERLYKCFQFWYSWYAWLDANVRSTPEFTPKVIAVIAIGLFTCCLNWTLSLAWYVIPCHFVFFGVREVFGFLIREFNRHIYGIQPPPPQLILYDLKLAKLDAPNLDELAEEFDSFPSSVSEVEVLRMRYDRLRKLSEKVVKLLGDLASQCERIEALFKLLDNPYIYMAFLVVCLVVVWACYLIPYPVWLVLFTLWWVALPWRRNDLPTAVKNLFRRLPTNQDLMF